MLSRLLSKLVPNDLYSLTIDGGQPPRIPRGTTRIFRDTPIDTRTVVIRPGDIKLHRLYPNVTYAEYFASNNHLRHADARVLDALFAQANAIDGLSGMYRHLKERHGQFIFFGSTFEMKDGGECVTFLNVNTNIPAMPHLRYQCPARDPIRCDVSVYACEYSPQG